MDIAREKSYPTPLANSTLLPILILSLMRQKNAPKTTKIFNAEYDYIIVGAGTAGSVVASRLSEMPCVSVLLLEAGESPPYITEVPGIAGSFWNSDVAWTYRTVPQKFTERLMENRQVIFRGGKMLGGSSSLNAMIYFRGNRKNYDDWAAVGAEGWSYKDVFPYFLKLEDNRDPEYVANGFYDHQATMREGQRCSTAKAYLVPAENRTNIDLLTKSMVRKVTEKVYGPYEGKPLYGCFANTVQPRSLGTVTLNSTNPYDPPIIDPNYLDDPRDMDDIVDGLKVCNRIGNSPELRRVGSFPIQTVYPGCEPFVGDENAYFRCLIKSSVSVLPNPVGTARMGNPKDPRTVVDPQLRVKDIKGLRVVDASVMPIIVSAGTYIPTIMIGEKASDIIKATIQCTRCRMHEE